VKVILNDQVENLGDRGAICDVKPGYARNFLIPKGIAYEATPANLARFKQEQRRWLEAMQKQKAQAELLAGKIAGLELTFYRRAGDGDALYGSVTSTDVAAALEVKGFEVDRRKIEIGQHIKRLGSFNAELHLHRDVRVPITLHVVREGEQASA
jgi:large subunit ribosomal protein L9